MDQPSTYQETFAKITGSPLHPAGFAPHPWQERLAASAEPVNRLIRIPTGEGKTLGVLSAWIYHRLVREDLQWPARLVWCLPMRTLVEQTASQANHLAEALGFSRDELVYQLMGGVDEQRWYQEPGRPAILIGTQDMLLSRALNRGYAMGRAAWPRAFGLLNTDSLWVMDEIQLMGVGLTTSAQLQSFHDSFQPSRADDRQSGIHRPRVTWWMSATLQPEWLHSPETAPFLDSLTQQMLTIDEPDRNGPQWNAQKPVTRIAGPPDNWSQMILDYHASHEPDPSTGRQTLVVLNTVRQASALYREIVKQLKQVDSAPQVHLIHSRFREAEREKWVESFLSRKSLGTDVNRILIATQVIEAGVDISASCLVTELAPWPSLVQRVGRAARYGGRATIVVLDQRHTDDKKAAPYAVAELDAARHALEGLNDVALPELEKFESGCDAETLVRLYPFDPVHVILQRELEELFDTSPDLSGADVDVSRFIREADDRNVQVFWRNWEGQRPGPELQPQRRELCSVPIGDAKTWLDKKERGQKRVWDYLDGQWKVPDTRNLRPGQMILVHPAAGGYDPERGFTGESAKKKQPVEPVDEAAEAVGLTSDRAETVERDSQLDWKTIATHCQEAAGVIREMIEPFGLPDRFTTLLCLVMRLHDWGKAHPAFASGTYRVEPVRADLAKAPPAAWRPWKDLYQTESHGPRRGFRHELASSLAALELLRLADPDHPALLGPHLELMKACGIEPAATPAEPLIHSLAEELQKLSATDFNLLLFLIAGHHGKVRCSMQSSPIDQEFPVPGDQDERFAGSGMPVRGVREADIVPPVALPDRAGKPVETPAITLGLQPASMGLSAKYGSSWTERVQALIAEFGPFALGWLEAVVRAADGNASDHSRPPGNRPDPLLDAVKLHVPEPEVISSESATDRDEISEQTHRETEVIDA